MSINRKVFAANLAQVMVFCYALAGLIVGFYVARLMLAHTSPVLGCICGPRVNPFDDIWLMSASVFLAVTSAIVVTIQFAKFLVSLMDRK